MEGDVFIDTKRVLYVFPFVSHRQLEKYGPVIFKRDIRSRTLQNYEFN